jgi:hypothetical protein
MNRKSVSGNAIIRVAAILIFIFWSSGCSRLSEIIHDEKAGINGGFETMVSGLPVNWYVYTMNIVPEGDFTITPDTVELIEGKQSLKFTVNRCLDHGGWHSPGIFQEFLFDSGSNILVSWWQKNKGCSYHINLYSYDLNNPRHAKNFQVHETGEPVDEWQKFEGLCNLEVEHERVRFELNILSPGIFRIDDFRIEKQLIQKQ